jgi:acyl carrier protein
MSGRTPFEDEVARLMVEVLNLEVSADEIAPDAPLYHDGLGLDSIDMLEIALAVNKQYGVELRADDERNRKVFASLRDLAAHVAEHRMR